MRTRSSRSAQKPARSAAKRQQGTFVLDPGVSVHHLLLRRDEVGHEYVDAIVAEFLQLVRARRRTTRTPVVLWRGQFTTAPPMSWPYWSLAIEERRVAWYKDLTEAARTVGSPPAMGMSTPGGPDGIGAAPYLLIESGSVAVFDQRRRVNSQTRITLAGKTFDVRTVQYRYPQPPAAAFRDEPVSLEDPDDLGAVLRRARGTVRLLQIRDRSPLQVWPEARESLIALSHEPHSADLSYDEAVATSESFGIPVVETSLGEHGRLVIEPLWVVSGEGRRIGDCRVTIALQGGLSVAQRRLALLHELGHYAHHLRYLASFLILYYRIAQNPAVEAMVAEQFPSSWHAARNRVMELEADYFSACFVVPHAMSGWLRDSHAPYDVTTVKGLLLRLMHRVFDEHWSVGRIGDDAVERAWRAVAESDYDVAASWFDRLAHCVALRGSDRLADLARAGGRLDDEMQKIDEMARQADAPPRVGDARFLDRCAEAEIAAVFSVPNRWDPVIVEPRRGTATGYLPLKPMFTKDDGVDVYDWSRADGYSPGFAGTIADWRETAAASGRGLMLFPMHPVEHALRRSYA